MHSRKLEIRKLHFLQCRSYCNAHIEIELSCFETRHLKEREIAMLKGTCFAHMLPLKPGSFQTFYGFQKVDNLLATEYNQSAKTLQYQVYFCALDRINTTVILVFKRAQLHAVWYWIGGFKGALVTCTPPNVFNFMQFFWEKTRPR